MGADYPEHEKMRVVRVQSQTIGEFIDWLQNEKRWDICRLDSGEQEYLPVYKSINELLAEYFQINLKAVEDEKQQMLAKLRAAHETDGAALTPHPEPVKP